MKFLDVTGCCLWWFIKFALTVYYTFEFQHVKTNIHPDSANFITSIVALGHISMLCPLEFGNSMKAIVSKNVVKDLLMVDRVSTDF